MCNQADHSDVDCIDESIMRNAGLVSERDSLLDCRDSHAGKEACDLASGELSPCYLDTMHAGKEACDYHVSGKSHHLQEKVEFCRQDGNEVAPCCCQDTSHAGKGACDQYASCKLHHSHEKIECSGQDSNVGTPSHSPHMGKEVCEHQVSVKLHELHEKVESSTDSNEVIHPCCRDTMVPLFEVSQTALNGAVGPIVCDIASQSVPDLTLAKSKLDGMLMEAKTGESDSIEAKEEQTESKTYPEMSSNEKYYEMPITLASGIQGKGMESSKSNNPRNPREGKGMESSKSRSISHAYHEQVSVEGIEILDSTVILSEEDSAAKQSQEAVMDFFQRVDNKAEDHVSSVCCFHDHSEEPFLEKSRAINQDPHDPSNSLESLQQDVGVEKAAVNSEEPSGVIQQESSQHIDEAANLSSMSKGTTGVDLASFFINAKGSKHETEHEDRDCISSLIKLPPKSKVFMESPRSLRVLLFSEGKIPTTTKDETKGLEFPRRVAPGAESNVHEGHTEYGFFNKGCDNKDNTEFMSFSFSGALTYQGVVAYSGPISYSGSVSHRSDSSASTRSFAFPILAPDWNSSSPVKMAAPDPRFLQQRRKWHFCVCCRRPSTLFD